MSRVFITGVGRCGTSTFFQACRHLTNYTAGHESEAGEVASYRFPENHIEVSSQLVVAIPLLRRRYPDARWVHLLRGREACIRSMTVQTWEWAAAWAFQWYQTRDPGHTAVGVAEIYDRVNDLIRELAPDAMTISIETAAEQWSGFCEWIRAEGDIEAGRNELSRCYNAGVARGRDNYPGKES